MKRMKGIGILALVLSGIVLLTGVFSLMLRGNNGLFSGLLESSKAAQDAVQAAQANVKAAESAMKKADSAVSAVQKALGDTQTAYASLEEVMRALDTHAEDGDPVHGLYARAEDAKAKTEEINAAIQTLDEQLRPLLGSGGTVEGAIDRITASAETAGEAVGKVNQSATDMLLASLYAVLEDAQQSVDKAVSAEADARKAVNAAQMVVSGTADLPEETIFPFAVEPPDSLLEGVMLTATELQEKASWLEREAAAAKEAATKTLEAAMTAQSGVTIGTRDRVVNWIATYYIAIFFTGLLLLAIGIVFTFFGAQFMRQWKRNAVFSTFIALVVMLVVQTYSMKFTYDTFGEWAKFWSDNAFNVLRANTSVGIIALGMTLVIITGGIDLAVGSTLAGVGTVLMVLIDSSPKGILLGLGITGVPAFILGIAGAFLTGALIGALIGLGVTKGRVPPFIITLGVMNIVRSIAQYFTKSYTPKVPPEFTGISNTVIFGQRLLPIVYWLVLAVILHVVMNRTRFGRYVYAVGSNERTTRLSGINVNRVKFMVYTLMGFLVSIAAVTQVSRLGGMDVASSGSGYELDAIAAVVVGGTSMSGGRGSIVGTVIGVLIIGVMNNLLILLGVDSFLTNAFKGAIVVAAVLVQRKEKEN